MKSFVLMSVLSFVLTGGVFGSEKTSCANGEVRADGSTYNKYFCKDGKWSKDCILGTVFGDGTLLCVKRKSKTKANEMVVDLWKCQSGVNIEGMELSGYECKKIGDRWTWVKPETEPEGDLGGVGKGDSQPDLPPANKPEGDLGGVGKEKPLSELMEKHKGLFEPIVWATTPVEVEKQLNTLAPRFNCAFKLRDVSKYGNYYSVFRGHGRERSYEKTKDFRKDRCPNGEVTFETSWTPFSEQRLKHFVWNLEFKPKKDKSGQDIKDESNSYLAKWNWGWYQLKPVATQTSSPKPTARGDLEWYDKKARKVEDALESGLGDCAVGTNCRSFLMFKHKLANCNMRQLYDSRCIAWAQSSKWVKSIIDVSNTTGVKEEIIRENVVYAFIAEELLSRFDPYTYTNRKVRAVLSFIKESKEYEALKGMLATLAASEKQSSEKGALSQPLSPSVDSKDVEYIMKRLAAPDSEKPKVEEAAEK